MITRRMMPIVALLAIVGATTLRADRVDEYVAAQMKRFDVPGISFAVLEERNDYQNRIVWFANGDDVDLIAVGHGVADLYLSPSPATTH